MTNRPWEAERMKAVPFSGIRKMVQRAEELERDGKSVIHLEIGRPDFDTPSHIKHAAARALEEGMVHYTSNYGIPELRGAIAEKLLDDNHLEFDPLSEIIVTAGANEAIFLAIMGTNQSRR
jgi:aminotransferase